MEEYRQIENLIYTYADLIDDGDITVVAKLLKNLRNAVDRFDADFSDALSSGQLKSKLWLVKSLIEANKAVLSSTNGQQKLQLGTIFLCGGWYGTLADMLFKTGLKIDKIRSFDIDPTCAPIAECVNKQYVINEWQFKAATLDIHDLRYRRFDYVTQKSDGTEIKLIDDANCVINTSCEHIVDFPGWYDHIPHGMLVAVQSNDYFEVPDHVNCSASLEAFKKQTPMRRELFSGTLELPNYNRFMRIGFKE